MPAIPSIGAARRLGLGAALLVGVAALLVALAPSTNAQQQPPAPHWFWGDDADAYAGSEIKAFNQSGSEVSTGGEGSGRIDADGTWFVAVTTEGGTRQVKLRIVSARGDRETGLLDVIQGGFSPAGLSITAFRPVPEELDFDGETISVRIIARRAPDGRIEFGMRDPDGENVLPPARYFPVGGPGHTRWLRSTEIDFGGGYVGRIIARHVEETGRTEFGFRVEGYPDIFPRARFFPASGPDHNRWLRSSEIEIGVPR